MKKFSVLLTGILLFATVSSFAQTSFGAKAGINIANMAGDDAEDLDSRIAPYFGGFANISLSEKLSFQPELLLSMKGAKITDDYVVKLTYLDIPLMVKLNLTESFMLEAGPQIGFNLAAKEEFDGDDEDIKDAIKGTEFGLGFGAGYQMNSGLGIGIRYNLGLSNILENGDAKNNVLQIGLSYAF